MAGGLWRFLLLAASSLVIACSQDAPLPRQVSAATFSNPVISGFAPDPSIVRVGEDFYLVNSSFEYFPGIPIYHSRDLVNWELLAYALHDPSQVDLADIGSSGGVHASTIRYHDGTFFVITTNVVEGATINFIVTAKDPRGPWSAPYVLDGAPGIDPSLYFDDDGRAWYVGNHIPPDPHFPGQAEIWLQELDLGSMQLTGERHFLWRGCCQGVWAEGPHIYKKDGYYYLLISEGGTSVEHALSVAISKSITGPYQNNPRNPVLTHRHISYDYPISGVGHADLVELQDGRWYAVALGWRLIDGRHGTLGRETFLLPLIWETEPHAWKAEKLTFPVFSPATGRIELSFPLPMAGIKQQARETFFDDFDARQLGPEWNFRRTPVQRYWSLKDQPGALRLRLQPGTIAEKSQYSFIGIRQRDFEFEALAAMRFTPVGGNDEAGLTLIQNDRSAIVLTASKAAAGMEVNLYRLFDGAREQLAGLGVKDGTLYFKVTGNYLDYSFYVSDDNETWQTVLEHVDGTSLSPAVIPGYNYTGVYVGLYATSNGEPAKGHADFEFFQYSPTATHRDAWYLRQMQNAPNN